MCIMLIMLCNVFCSVSWLCGSVTGCFAILCGNYCVFWTKCIPKNDSFREPSCPKPQRHFVLSVTFRSWQSRLLLLVNRADPTTFASQHHCHVRTYLQIRKSFNPDCSFCAREPTSSVASRMRASAKEATVAYRDICAQVQMNVIGPPHPNPTKKRTKRTFGFNFNPLGRNIYKYKYMLSTKTYTNT